MEVSSYPLARNRSGAIARAVCIDMVQRYSTMPDQITEMIIQRPIVVSLEQQPGRTIANTGKNQPRRIVNDLHKVKVQGGATAKVLPESVEQLTKFTFFVSRDCGDFTDYSQSLRHDTPQRVQMD